LDLSQTEYQHVESLANGPKSIDYDARSKALDGQCNNTE